MIKWRVAGTILAAFLVQPPQMLRAETPLSPFVEANAIHTLFHEIGHALVTEFALPVIGQEEDAVDAFATIEIIYQMPDDAEAILVDVASNWLYLDAQTDREDLDFYDIHDLDAQRAYRTICHLYGLDPETHTEAADWVELPEDTREICEETGALAADSWDALLREVIRSEDDPVTPIEVEHGPSDDAQLRARVIESGILEDMAEYARLSFLWPDPLTFTAKDCGEANAFWDPGSREVILCYEIVADWALTEAALKRE